MKAEAAPGLVLRDEPVPELGPTILMVADILIGEDGHLRHGSSSGNGMNGRRRPFPLPMVVGHEFAGRVEAVGSHVRTVKVGDRVSGEGHLIGMKSRMARAGISILIRKRRALASMCRALSPNICAFRPSTPFICPMRWMTKSARSSIRGNAVHTALSFDLVGEDVLITGRGPIGIMAAAVCRHVGARHVVVTDINDYRLSLCNTVCDAITVNVAKEECAPSWTGSACARASISGLKCPARRRLRADDEKFIMGGKDRDARHSIGQMPVDWNSIIFQGADHQGHLCREMFETWYKMIAMLQSGSMCARSSHRMKAAEYARGFDLMAQGSCGKVVLDWG